ncbi:hypothetical protein ACFV1L_25180 [Kitasatospora sp. NPDC059646]|uniref:hypothetical protein n=1 Tax=Kitasatospora sp. NPDC059646 TaxID=3346893 RepID=UPI0036BD3E9B
MAWDDDGPRDAARTGRTGCWWLLACLPLAWLGSGEVLQLSRGYPPPCVPGSAGSADFFLTAYHLLVAPAAFALLVAAGLLARRPAARWRLLLWTLIVLLIHLNVRHWLQGPADFC